MEPLKQIFECILRYLCIPNLPDVAEWAQKAIFLSSKGGTVANCWWSLTRNPWAQPVLDFMRGRKKVLVLVLGTQMGKTTLLYIMLAYHIVFRRTTAIMYYPTREFAKRMVQTRWKHLVYDSPVLRPLVRNWAIHTQEFEGSSSMWLGTENRTDTQGASPEFACVDEVGNVDKGKIDIEAGQVDTGAVVSIWHRIREAPMGKLVLSGSPKSYNDILWTWLEKTTFCKQFLPSPHAPDQKFTLEWEHIQWTEHKDADGNTNIKKTLETVWYKCPITGKKIEDKDKAWMLKNFEWRPTNLNADPEFEGYNCSALYIPKHSWKDIVSEFLLLRDTPGNGEAQFYNGTLALPYRNEAQSATEQMIYDLTLGEKDGEGKWIVEPYERGEIRGDVRYMGIDAQGDKFFYVVLGFSLKTRRVFLLEWGEQPNLMALSHEYTKFQCKGACVDEGSGNMSASIRKQVYNLDKTLGANKAKQNWFTVKGFATIKGDYRQTTHQRNAFEDTADAGKKYMVTCLQTNNEIWYPELALLRSRKKAGLFLPKNIDQMLVKHLTSVQLASYKDARGNLVEKWEEDLDFNHLWDAMRYGLSLADYEKAYGQQLNIVRKPSARVGFEFI